MKSILGLETIIIGKKKRCPNKEQLVLKHYKYIFNSSPLEACKGYTLDIYNENNIVYLTKIKTKPLKFQ